MRLLPRALAAAVALLLVSVAPAHATNDPEWGKQWGPTQMNAPSAWAKSKGAGVTIAVVDSGVDVDHPDLKPKLDRAGSYDFGDNDSNPDDDSTLTDGSGKPWKGHGTHVAGTAAAATDNSIGMAGVAPDAKIMALKMVPSNEYSILTQTTVTNAINHAVDRGAKVINLSLVTFDTGVSLVGYTQTPCSNAFQRGVLCIIASGNSGAERSSGYPRDYPGLVVTAHQKDGAHAGFGQKADTQWAVSAPGVDILSAVPVEDGSYGTKQGTSMAAPHAAGLAALVYADLKPPPTAAGTRMVIDAILSGARGTGNPGTEGAGQIDAAATLKVPVIAEPAGDGSGGTSGGGSTQGPAGNTGGRGAAAPSSGGGAAAPSSGDAPVAGGDPAAITDPTAPQTEGIQLAGADDAAAEGESEDQPVDGSKATLYTLAGAMVLLTGAWSLSNYTKELKSKRLKPFSEA